MQWSDEWVGTAVARIAGLQTRFFDERDPEGRWELEHSCRRSFVRRGEDAVGLFCRMGNRRVDRRMDRRMRMPTIGGMPCEWRRDPSEYFVLFKSATLFFVLGGQSSRLAQEDESFHKENICCLKSGGIVTLRKVFSCAFRRNFGSPRAGTAFLGTKRTHLTNT